MDASGRYAGGVILALDSATRTGAAWGEPGGTPKLETVNFGKPLIGPLRDVAPKGDNEGDMFGRALVWITRKIDPAYEFGVDVKLIVIEGLVPQYDKTIQCGLWAVFCGVAATKNIPVVVAPIQTWRAFVLGDGRIKKEAAKTRAVQTVTHLGWEADSHDAAEAGCIWLWACSQVAPRLAPRIPLFMRGAA